MELCQALPAPFSGTNVPEPVYSLGDLARDTVSVLRRLRTCETDPPGETILIIASL